MQTYHITPKKNNNSISANQWLNSQGELIEDSNQLVDILWANLQKYTVPEKAFRIISNPNDLAEIQSLLTFEMAGALTSRNTGATGAKPDNIIGFLAIDTDYLSPITGNNNNSQLLKKIEAIIKKIDDLINHLRNTNTTQYYQD